MMEWIVTSSAMILIVIALRGLLKGKISLKLQYGLWALVLVRLLLPFSIVDSAISVSNILSAPVIREADDAVADYETVYQSAVQRHESSGTKYTDTEIRQQVQQELYDREYSRIEKEYAQTGAPVPEIQIQAEAQQQVEVISLTAVIMEALPYFWVAGMVAVAAALIGSNLHFGWKLRKSRAQLNIPDVPLKVYLTDYVATPCLFGAVKPDIYLTGEVMTDSKMRHHVIAHEMSHYRQGDHIWSVLRCVCLVLHWYNPLVWAAAILSKQDAELACDEATIKALGEAERVAYGRTLIGMTCVRRDPSSLMLTATTMLGTKKTLKERIALIAKKPKTALYTLIACVLVVSLAVGCTFTGAPLAKEETLLERCRDAVEYIQNLEHFEIAERTEVADHSDSEILGLPYEEARYVHSGDDWLHTLIGPDWTWQFINKDRYQYRKDVTSAIPEKDIPYPDWTGGDFSNVHYANHCWIMDFEWKDSGFVLERNSVRTEYNILSVSVETDGDYEQISLDTEIVDGPEDSGNIVFTFCFDTNSNEVVRVIRTASDQTSTITNTLVINPSTKEEMSAIIDSIYYGEIVNVVPTPETYEWEPAAHNSLSFDEYFDQAQPVEEVITWLDWTAADGMSRYHADYGRNSLYVEYLDPEGQNRIVWEVPISEQYGDVAIMLCDGVYVYGVRQRTELVRINLKTGIGETIFTADEMMCGFTGDGSCKNIFIMDRDWLYFLAKDNGMIRIYRMYLPDLSVEAMGGYIPEDTLPTFLDLKYHPDDRTEITCTYLNPDLQRVLLNEINNPNSSYRDVTIRVGNESLNLNWSWENKEELRLESTYYWYGPFDYLRVQLQSDKNIPGCVVITCDGATGKARQEDAWMALPENASHKPVFYNPDIAKFQEMLTYDNGYWYWMAMGCVFEQPEDISLYCLLYNGLPQDERQNSSDFTDSEVEFLKDVAVNSTWRDESVWVNAHKMPRQYIDDMLHDYFGISIEDVTVPEEWSYFEETDSYYYIRSDAYGVNGYTVTDVQTNDNGLIYVYWTANFIRDTRYEDLTFINEPQMVMVLEERLDGSYLVHMNMPVEELLRPTDEEYFRELLTSQNGYWYWRAMGCVFEKPEDIDMTLLCYGGMEKRILYSTFTDDEIAFLKTQNLGIAGDDSAWSNAHKLPRQELDAALQAYFGVTLDDVTIPTVWVYYSETDAYYHVKYDSYGLVGYTVTDVVYHEDGTISVYWFVPFGLWDTRNQADTTFLSDVDMLLTLKTNDDGTYTVLSNLPVEE